jgi:7,8-dihydro-6-hydroxymethylpterin dimethyltransferase
LLENREYIYLSATQSFCHKCKKLVPAKIIHQADAVYILKNCPVHGEIKELYEEDSSYHLRKSFYDKPGTKPKTETTIKNGCPYDCGLCPSHDQHSCIGLIEITNKCDLKCPDCYANSGEGDHLGLKKINEMMKFFMEAEDGNAEILQISGGEPTTHPDIIEIIKMARKIGFKYVMLNTNGIRISQDEEFVRALSQFVGGFEIYLQYDGNTDEIYERLRGKKLAKMKGKAIANLVKHKIPTTLVCTVSKGINDNAIGEILGFAMDTKYIRGVNFQPLAFFGRADRENLKNANHANDSDNIKDTINNINDKNSINTKDRITLSGVLKRIENQTNGMIKSSDFIPLPCNVERVAITYLLKGKSGFIPIIRDKDFEKYTPYVNNTFIFSVEDVLKNSKDVLLSPVKMCKCFDSMKVIHKHIPKGFSLKSKEERIDFVDENTFRISVSSFVDMYNFDIKSMQKECVHIITKDLKRIPFSAYNMLHRSEELE